MWGRGVPGGQWQAATEADLWDGVLDVFYQVDGVIMVAKSFLEVHIYHRI